MKPEDQAQKFELQVRADHPWCQQPAMNLPTQLILELITCAALVFAGYWIGRADERTNCEASKAQAQQLAQKKTDEINTQREQVAQSREVSRERVRVVYRTIKEKVDENVKNNPALNDCGLDDDGLLIWNAANAGETAPVLSKPDYRLSSAAASQVGKVEGLVPQPHRSDGDVHAVSGPAEETSGMRR